MNEPPPPAPGAERRQLSREEWLAEALGDIDPAKHAGESWFATDEYARPGDIGSPWTRAEVGREGDYYPRGDFARRHMRGY